MVCGFDVSVINCHYICNNCGFAANWDEGSDPSSGYEIEDKITDKKETDELRE